MPQNLPERVARKKLVEELLDQIGERGFLTMGDLRDAISRNNLKLPDLSEPLDFFRGDQLLRADRKLAAGARRRLSARRVLLAMDAAAQFAGVRHAHRPLSDPLRRRALRRGVRDGGLRAPRVGIDHRRRQPPADTDALEPRRGASWRPRDCT